MSYIVIKAIPEELKHIAERGNLIMYDDLSLYVKTQSDTIEQVKGKDYNKLMDYLNKSMKLYTDNNSPFNKRFTENDSQILVYETDKNILTSIDENIFKSETGLKIKYEVGMVPEYFTPMSEMGNAYYLNDPANVNNPTELISIITSMRNRLTYIQSILNICILYSGVTDELNSKYLADGDGFNNSKYPFLKTITDNIATGNVDTGIIETTLSSKYLPKGASFNTTKYPNVKTVVDHIADIRMSTETFKNKVINSYLPKGTGYNSVKYPNLQSIVNYMNSMMDTIKSTITSLTYKINIGSALANYPDAYAIVNKLTTLASSISTIQNTINVMKAKVANYLPKGDTTYPSVAYLVSEMVDTENKDNLNYAMTNAGESSLPTTMNSALEIAMALDILVKKVQDDISAVVVKKLPYTESFDLVKYPDAQTIANKVAEVSSEVTTQEEDFNTFITDVLPLYMKKNGFVPYTSFYQMYLGMLDIQSRMVKIQRVLDSKVCKVALSDEKFTYVPKFQSDIAYDYTDRWSYIGGYATSTVGTRLHPYYFATCMRDDSQGGTCDPIFQMAYKHTNGKYYGIRLPWDEWSEGDSKGSEDKDRIWTWEYGARSVTAYSGGQGSSTVHFNVDFTYSPSETSYEGKSLSEFAYWSDCCFSAGCRGIDNQMYILTFSGNLVKLDVPAFVLNTRDGNTASPIRNLITGDTWLGTSTFYASHYDDAANSTKQGFGYWTRRRSHIVDTGRVGGNKIVCIGTRMHAGSVIAGEVILCVYNKTANKSTYKSIGTSTWYAEVTYMTAISDTLIYWENSVPMQGNRKWGFFEITWSGSDFTYVRHEYPTPSSILPIICAIQNTDIVLVMDIGKGTHHFIKNTNIDITSIDTVLKRNDSFGLSKKSELTPDSKWRDLYYTGSKYTTAGSASYELFMGLNDGGRHIVYEPDQDDIMTLCVNNCRFKFTGTTEGIVIEGETYEIT